MSGFQVQDHQLTEKQRLHLQTRLFPLLARLQRVARERLATKGVA